jgi:hypothetical protein
VALWRASADDLSAFVCERCPRNRQRNLGCHGGAASTYYADRREESDTCPRRHLRRNPDLGPVFDLWRLYGGVPSDGVATLDALTPAALEALWVMDSAVAYRREQEEAAAVAKAEAAAAARQQR